LASPIFLLDNAGGVKQFSTKGHPNWRSRDN
jgi:hypothetical protein